MDNEEYDYMYKIIREELDKMSLIDLDGYYKKHVNKKEYYNETEYERISQRY